MDLYTGVTVVAIVIGIGSIFWHGIQNRSRRSSIKGWALRHHLNYQKRVRFGILRLSHEEIKSIVWGIYNNKPVYIFNIERVIGDRSAYYYTFVNGNFYEQLSSNDIEDILSGNTPRQQISIKSILTPEVIVQSIRAYLFLRKNIEVDYFTIRKIYNAATKKDPRIMHTDKELIKKIIEEITPKLQQQGIQQDLILSFFETCDILGVQLRAERSEGFLTSVLR